MKKQSYFEMSRIGAEYDEDEHLVLTPEEGAERAGASIGRHDDKKAPENDEKEPDEDILEKL